MIERIIFDVDGVVIDRNKKFSRRFCEKYNVSMELITPFFQNEYKKCLLGQADLKNELKKYLKKWKWRGSVEELLGFWFQGEKSLNQEILKDVAKLKSGGKKCYLATDNEKYRIKFLIEELKIDSYFDELFFPEKINYIKREPNFWLGAWDALRRPDKQSVLVWDDDEENVAAARKAGLQAEFYDNFSKYKEIHKNKHGL